MKSTIQSVEKYLEGYSGQERKQLEALRRIILKTDSAITEKIAWGAPTYYRKGYLVQFAAARNHIGFYTSPETLRVFKEELKGYKTNEKNTVHFPTDQDIPADLVRRMVLYRIDEISDEKN